MQLQVSVCGRWVEGTVCTLHVCQCQRKGFHFILRCSVCIGPKGLILKKEITCTLAAKVFRDKVLPDIKSSPYSLCACG